MKIFRKNTAMGHYYIDQDTGERVPGVTTIVGDGMPKPALLNWAGKATADVHCLYAWHIGEGE